MRLGRLVAVRDDRATDRREILHLDQRDRGGRVSEARVPDTGAGARDGTVRVDPLSGAPVHVVSGRQDRPMRPADGCPFCVGGLEAPEPYEVRWFPNRWPAMAADRCEVVLYAPKHGAAFWSLGVDGARRVVDVWAERTAALGARPDVGYVLVFENRGAAVGATIDHPHGQIYAFGEVPPVPTAEAERAGADDPLAAPGRPRHDRRHVAGWRAWVPASATHPLELVLAPEEPLADLPSAHRDRRDGLAALLVDVLERCDRLYDEPLPYMLWVHQRPPRRRRLARAPAPAPRVAHARRRHLAVRGRRRAGFGRVLQPGRPAGGRRAPPLRRRSFAPSGGLAMPATLPQLSAEQVRQYRDEGYVVLGKVLTDDDIAELLVEEERLRPEQGYGAEGNRTLVVSMQHCHRSAAVRRVLHERRPGAVGRAAARARRVPHPQPVPHQAARRGRHPQRHPDAPGQRVRPSRAPRRHHGVGRADRGQPAQRRPRTSCPDRTASGWSTTAPPT